MCRIFESAILHKKKATMYASGSECTRCMPTLSYKILVVTKDNAEIDFFAIKQKELGINI